MKRRNSRRGDEPGSRTWNVFMVAALIVGCGVAGVADAAPANAGATASEHADSAAAVRATDMWAGLR